MTPVIKTDILIIGAGPCGLFTVFEAGLLNLKCHLVDSLGSPGGQLTEIYPKKPIYDIPGYPEILASDLVQNLLKQIEPFNPKFTLGETAVLLKRLENQNFEVTTNKGTLLEAPVIAIAGGLGSFEPRKPLISNIENYEDKGIDYIIRDPEKYRSKNVVISGGGDSALDWALFLVNIATSVTVIHRRTEFRGAPESVLKLLNFVKEGKIQLLTESEVTHLAGEQKLEWVIVNTPTSDQHRIDCDYFIPLFGLTPKLGPIADWGLELEKNAIVVNTTDFGTNIEGIFAIGDVNTYPGKLKLILCGFHEAALMVQSAYKAINGGRKPSFKYTTVTGINRLD